MATTDTPPRVVDVQAFIDAEPVSALQKRLLFLCFIVIAIDGFDTAIIGYIAPAVRAEWGLAVTQLGPLFAAGLFGLMLGAFAVGPLADRHGRKTMLVVSMILFGAASLGSSLSSGLPSLIALRFLTGLGLGGAMPMTITLASEFCPRTRRSSLVTLMFCGLTLGSAMAGLIAARVLPGSGLLKGTLLLWVAFFTRLLGVYLMTNWMPTLLQQASGASIADAAFIGAMYQVGGTLGAILVGRLMDRFEPHRVLLASYGRRLHRSDHWADFCSGSGGRRRRSMLSSRFPPSFRPWRWAHSDG